MQITTERKAKLVLKISTELLQVFMKTSPLSEAKKKEEKGGGEKKRMKNSSKMCFVVALLLNFIAHHINLAKEKKEMKNPYTFKITKLITNNDLKSLPDKKPSCTIGKV